jgi:hypothetical protein
MIRPNEPPISAPVLRQLAHGHPVRDGFLNLNGH